MGPKTLAPIVLFVLLTFTCGACAQRSGRSVAPSPAWNDNSLIAIQKTGGEPARPGDVKIEFYGHDAFKITSPAGLTVLTVSFRVTAWSNSHFWCKVRGQSSHAVLSKERHT